MAQLVDRTSGLFTRLAIRDSLKPSRVAVADDEQQELEKGTLDPYVRMNPMLADAFKSVGDSLPEGEDLTLQAETRQLDEEVLKRAEEQAQEVIQLTSPMRTKEERVEAAQSGEPRLPMEPDSAQEDFYTQEIERLEAELAGRHSYGEKGGHGLQFRNFWDDMKAEFSTLIETPESPLRAVPFLGSVAEIAKGGRVAASSRRMALGLDDAQDRYIALKYLRDEQVRGDRGAGGAAAGIVTRLPAFAGEIAATGGAFTVARSGTMRGISKVAGERIAQSVAGRIPGFAAGAGAATAVNQPLVLAEAMRAADPTLTLDEAGQVVATLTGDDNFAEVIASHYGEGFLRAYIEIYSEYTGVAFKPILGIVGRAGKAPLKALGNAPGMNPLRIAAASRWMRSKPGRNVSGLMKKTARLTQWQGMPAEIMEERVGELMRGVTGLDPFQIAPFGEGGWNQLAVEAIAFSVPGAGRRGIQLAGRGIEKSLRAAEESQDPAAEEGVAEEIADPPKTIAEEDARQVRGEEQAARTGQVNFSREQEKGGPAPIGIVDGQLSHETTEGDLARSFSTTMSPQEYLTLADQDVSGERDQTVEAAISEGAPVGPPALYVESSESGVRVVGQAGRRRAQAAIDHGVDEIEVDLILPEGQRIGDLGRQSREGSILASDLAGDPSAEVQMVPPEVKAEEDVGETEEVPQVFEDVDEAAEAKADAEVDVIRPEEVAGKVAEWRERAKSEDETERRDANTVLNRIDPARQTPVSVLAENTTRGSVARLTAEVRGEGRGDFNPQVHEPKPGSFMDRMRDAFEKIGIRVLFVDFGDAAEEFTGYTDPHPGSNTIVIHSGLSSERAVDSIAAHEIVGHVFWDTPAFAALEQFFRDEFSDTYRFGARQYYDAMMGEKGTEEGFEKWLLSDTGRQEAVAVMIEDMVAEGDLAMLELAQARTPVFMQKVLDVVERILAAVSGPEARRLIVTRHLLKKALGQRVDGGVNVRGLSSNTWESDEAAEPDGAFARNRKIAPQARVHAVDYAAEFGIEYDFEGAKGEQATAFVTTLKQVADAYEKAEHSPGDASVLDSYHRLQAELLMQYRFMKRKGILADVWRGLHDPYSSSSEQAVDLENGHVWFRPKSAAGAVEFDEDHPMSEPAGEFVQGYELTYDDLLRITHAYFGHAKEGNSTNTTGRENAWRQHTRLFSSEARAAFTTETRGRVAWEGFGPQARRVDGTLAEPGEADYVHPARRENAPRKVALLPAWMSDLDRTPRMSPRLTRMFARARTNIHRISEESSRPTLTENEDKIGPSSIARWLDEVWRKSGRKPASLSDKRSMDRAVKQAVEEVREFMGKHPDIGVGWYDKTIEEAVTLAEKFIPELKGDVKMRKFLKLLTGPLSNGSRPPKNFQAAVIILRTYLDTGQLPLANTYDNASQLGSDPKRNSSVQGSMFLLQHMLDKMGIDGVADFATSEQTIGDLMELRRAAGYKRLRTDSMAGKKSDTVLGWFIFGPKTGRFGLAQLASENADLDGSTIDTWMIRDTRRLIGRNSTDAGGSNDKHDPTLTVAQSQALNAEIAERLDLSLRDAQAIRWYMIIMAYREWGQVSARAEDFLNGARELTEHDRLGSVWQSAEHPVPTTRGGWVSTVAHPVREGTGDADIVAATGSPEAAARVPGRTFRVYRDPRHVIDVDVRYRATSNNPDMNVKRGDLARRTIVPSLRFPMYEAARERAGIVTLADENGPTGIMLDLIRQLQRSAPDLSGVGLAQAVQHELQARGHTGVRMGEETDVFDPPRRSKFARPRRGADRVRELVEKHGTTEVPRKAGFILPDGRLLDLSGGRDEKSINHFTVAPNVTDFSIDTGALRMTASLGTLTLEVRRSLTSEQMRRVRQLIDNVDRLVIDVLGPSGQDLYFGEISRGQSRIAKRPLRGVFDLKTLSQILSKKMNSIDGFTLPLVDTGKGSRRYNIGTQPTTGFAVGVEGHEKRLDKPVGWRDVQSWLESVLPVMDETHHLGAWENEGQVVLDISAVYQDKSTAMAVARGSGESAVWDLEAGQEVLVGEGEAESGVGVKIELSMFDLLAEAQAAIQIDEQKNPRFKPVEPMHSGRFARPRGSPEEWVEQVAVIVDGKVYTTPNIHEDAFRVAFGIRLSELERKNPLAASRMKADEEAAFDEFIDEVASPELADNQGYVTNKGRYLTRQEAADLAIKLKQIHESDVAYVTGVLPMHGLVDVEEYMVEGGLESIQFQMRRKFALARKKRLGAVPAEKPVTEEEARMLRSRDRRVSTRSAKEAREAAERKARGIVQQMRVAALAQADEISTLRDQFNRVIDTLPKEIKKLVRGELSHRVVQRIKTARGLEQAFDAVDRAIVRVQRRRARDMMERVFKRIPKKINVEAQRAIKAIAGDIDLKNITENKEKQLRTIIKFLQRLVELSHDPNSEASLPLIDIPVKQDTIRELERVTTKIRRPDDMTTEEMFAVTEAVRFWINFSKKLSGTFITEQRERQNEESGKMAEEIAPRFKGREGLRPSDVRVLGQLINVVYSMESKLKPERYAEFLGGGTESTTFKVLWERIQHANRRWKAGYRQAMDHLSKAVEDAGYSSDGDARLAKMSHEAAGEYSALQQILGKGKSRETRAEELEITLEDGTVIKPTMAEVMMLWAVLEDEQLVRQISLRQRPVVISRKSNIDVAYLSPKDIIAIQNMGYQEDGTPTAERAIVESLLSYVNGPLRDVARSASIREFGGDRTRSGTHWSIHTIRRRGEEPEKSRQLRATDYIQETIGSVSIMQHRAEEALAAIQVVDVFRSFRNYAWQIHGFAEMSRPIRDAEAAITSQNVQAAVDPGRTRRGERFNKYWRNFFDSAQRSVVGGPRSTQFMSESAFASLANNFVRASLGYNPRVMMYQPVSAYLAGTELGEKFILRAMSTSAWTDGEVSRRMQEWSDLIWLRYQDSGYGLINEFAGRETGILGHRPNETKGMRGIQMMDMSALRVIWVAAEMKVAEERKDLERGSPRFYREVAEHAERAVRKTQPDHDPMNTSGLGTEARRSPIFRLMVLFRSQRNQLENMVLESVWRYNRTKHTDPAAAKIALARMATAVVGQTLFIAAIGMAWDLLLNLGPPDEDRGGVWGAAISRLIDTSTGILYFGDWYAGLPAHGALNAFIPSAKTFEPELNPIEGSFLGVYHGLANVRDGFWDSDEGFQLEGGEIGKGVERVGIGIGTISGVPLVAPYRMTRRLALAGLKHADLIEEDHSGRPRRSFR